MLCDTSGVAKWEGERLGRREGGKERGWEGERVGRREGG